VDSIDLQIHFLVLLAACEDIDSLSLKPDLMTEQNIAKTALTTFAVLTAIGASSCAATRAGVHMQVEGVVGEVRGSE
jgi:hypothetical protein